MVEFNQIIPFAHIALIKTMLWLNLIKSFGTTKIRCNILLRRRVNFSWSTVHVNMYLSPPFFVCVENLLVYYVYSWAKQIQNSFGHVNKVLLNEDRSNRHSDNAPHKTQTARDCLLAIAFASLQSHIVWICKTQVSKLQLLAFGVIFEDHRFLDFVKENSRKYFHTKDKEVRDEGFSLWPCLSP